MNVIYAEQKWKNKNMFGIINHYGMMVIVQMSAEKQIRVSMKKWRDDLDSLFGNIVDAMSGLTIRS
tara:strand:- start:85 stop:282 length:198 start_codon:yes stop_codon:yes gene_type:complete